MNVMVTAGLCPLQKSGRVEFALASYCNFNLGGIRKNTQNKNTCLRETKENRNNLWKCESISFYFNRNMQTPVVGEQLQRLGGESHVKGALTGDHTGCRTFWAGFPWHVWWTQTKVKNDKHSETEQIWRKTRMQRLNQSIRHCSGLTEAPADVDVEVDAVIAVVHQEAVAHLDQWAEVMLLPICVEHVTRHLHTARWVSRFRLTIENIRNWFITLLILMFFSDF